MLNILTKAQLKRTKRTCSPSRRPLREGNRIRLFTFTRQELEESVNFLSSQTSGSLSLAREGEGGQALLSFSIYTVCDEERTVLVRGSRHGDRFTPAYSFRYQAPLEEVLADLLQLKNAPTQPYSSSPASASRRVVPA